MVDARRPPVALVRGGRDRQAKRPGARSRRPGSAKGVRRAIHPSCIVCAMAYRAAVVGGVRAIRAPSCCGCSPATPRSRSSHVTADSNAGARVADLFPGLAPGVSATPCSRRSTRPTCAGFDLVFCLLPHGASQDAAARDSSTTSAHVIDLGADFRLPADVYARWYGEAHDAPEMIGRFAYGLVELYRDDLATHAHVAAPGCYPTAVSLACAPLVRARSRRTAPHCRRGVGGVRCGPRPQDHEPVLGGERERLRRTACSRTATRAEMEQALSKVARRPVDVLFTPHLVPTTRGILATCYARPAASGLSTARLLEHYRDFYADDPCVVVVDEPSGTKATYGANVVHVTVRFDERTDTRHRDRRRGQPREGRVGSDDPGRERPARPARDHRPAAARDPAVSVTRRRRVRRGRARLRDQGVGRCPISRSSPPPITPRSRPRACSRRTSRRPRRCRCRSGICANGRAAAVVLSSGNANAATGEPGRRDATRMCELDRPRPRLATDDVLVCSTGLIGIPMPMDALEAGIPKLCGQLATDGGGAAAAGDDDDRHGAEGSACPRRVRRRPSAAWPRARRCCRPRWPRCSPSSRPTPRSSPPRCSARSRDAVASTFDCLSVDGCRSTNDTVLVLANGRAGAVDTARAHRRAHRRCADRWPSRWHATPKARRSSCASASSVRAPMPTPRVAARAVANSQLVQCSLNGDDPYWGRVLSELGASGAHLDPEQVDIAYNGVIVCRDGIACAHDAAALAAAMAAPDIEILCDLRLGARRSHRAHDRPVARVHRREPAHLVSVPESRRRRWPTGSPTRARRRTSSPRRCRTSASSRARPS